MRKVLDEQEIKRRRIFGDRLKKLRKTKRLTLAYMGKQLGLSSTAYMQYERGQREPSNKGLIIIADVLGVSMDYLFFGREEDSPENNEYEHAVEFWQSAGYDVLEKDETNEGNANIELTCNEKNLHNTLKQPLLKVISFEDKLSFVKFTKYAENEFVKKVEELKREISTKVMGKAYLKVFDDFISFPDVLNNNSVATV